MAEYITEYPHFFTANLLKKKPKELKDYLVNVKDRKYQFWKSNDLSFEIWSEKVLLAKLKCMHQNSVRADICRFAEKHKYSSAQFYRTGKDNWGFLTQIRD